METTKRILALPSANKIKRNAQDEHSREQLENRVLDAEIHHDELRTEILALLAEYRYMKWYLRGARAQLAHDDFLAGVADTFGPEIAAVVAEHSRP
jgi:hypothetical protein